MNYLSTGLKKGCWLLAISCWLCSCEQVIDLDLNGAEKKYVIEAVVADKAGTARVLISQTKDFDQDNNFTGISGATVTITEAGGATTVLGETIAGIYENSGLVASSGKTYSLSVKIGSNQFSAVCTVPQKVNLDTVYVSDEFLFTETRKIVNTEYKDPAGRGNSYRFIQYVNTKKENQILIQNDEYTDGRYVNTKLFYFSDDDDDEEEGIKSGDEIKVDMLCIDPAVFKYWYSLSRSATGTSGQATPANPVSNMQGGALGYFSAHTLQTKSFIVP